jgi:hypothetical protein
METPSQASKAIRSSPLLLALKSGVRPQRPSQMGRRMPSRTTSVSADRQVAKVRHASLEMQAATRNAVPETQTKEAAPRVIVDGSKVNYARLQHNELDAILGQLAPESDLQQIRKRLIELDEQVEYALQKDDFKTAVRLRDEKRKLQQKDPGSLYSLLEEELELAVREERYGDASRLNKQLQAVRRHLPQFKLEGLWKGDYGDHGETIIRITYDGDVMEARKVTGDPHVPAGAVTFRADLSSKNEKGAREADDERGTEMEVIKMGSNGEETPQEVEEFGAEGVIATMDYGSPQYIPGRLFLMDKDAIAFLWIPIGVFVFFTRIDQSDLEDKMTETRAELERLMQYSH